MDTRPLLGEKNRIARGPSKTLVIKPIRSVAAAAAAIEMSDS